MIYHGRKTMENKDKPISQEMKDFIDEQVKDMEIMTRMGAALFADVEIPPDEEIEKWNKEHPDVETEK